MNLEQLIAALSHMVSDYTSEVEVYVVGPDRIRHRLVAASLEHDRVELEVPTYGGGSGALTDVAGHHRLVADRAGLGEAHGV
jgi:hypothetical protein